MLGIANALSVGMGGASTIWTPSSLSSIVAWWDSTLGVTGSPVDSWDAQEGGATWRFTASGTARPTIVSGPGGKTVIRHDGSDDILATSAAAVAQPFQVFMVFALNASPAVGDRLLETASGAAYYVAWNGAVIRFYFGTVYDSTAPLSSVGTWDYWSFLGNGASSVVSKNGTPVAAGNVGANGLNGIKLFGASGTTATMPADVRAIVITSAQVTGADLTALQAWLAARRDGTE